MLTFDRITTFKRWLRGLRGKSMTESKTERARYTFVVKAFPGGPPWIVLERSGKSLDVLGDGLLGFDLTAGTTLKEAEELAALLRHAVIQVSYTSLK
jgi:hypothetical protein